MLHGVARCSVQNPGRSLGTGQASSALRSSALRAVILVRRHWRRGRAVVGRSSSSVSTKDEVARRILGYADMPMLLSASACERRASSRVFGRLGRSGAASGAVEREGMVTLW